MQHLAEAFGPQWQQRLVAFASGGSPQRLAAKQELLATTDYGRCVYQMDNDQPDHYVSNIEFAGDASLLSSTIDDAIESHAMALKAEQSRLGGEVETL